MTPRTMAFGRAWIKPFMVRRRSVLELGARNVNGSYRDIIEPMRPARYVGVDFRDGPGVDILADFMQPIPGVDGEQFGMVVSTETLEHVHDWQQFIGIMKLHTTPRGYLIVTTRSPGFAYHDYPEDHWRFTLPDLVAAFDIDCDIIGTWFDANDQGVGIVAQRIRNAPLYIPAFDVQAVA
jgi:methyltransferase family protein